MFKQAYFCGHVCEAVWLCREEQTDNDQSNHCNRWLNEKTTDALFNASVFLAGHLLSWLNSAWHPTTSPEDLPLCSETSHQTATPERGETADWPKTRKNRKLKCRPCEMLAGAAFCTCGFFFSSAPLLGIDLNVLTEQYSHSRCSFLIPGSPTAWCSFIRCKFLWRSSSVSAEKNRIPLPGTRSLNHLCIWGPQAHEVYLMYQSSEYCLTLHMEVLAPFVSSVVKILNLVQTDFLKNVVLFQLSDMLGRWPCKCKLRSCLFLMKDYCYLSS